MKRLLTIVGLLVLLGGVAVCAAEDGVTDKEVVIGAGLDLTGAVANWGVKGEHPGDPSRVNVLVLDRRLLGDQAAIFQRLTAPGGEFQLVFDKDSIVGARRVRPPSPS